MTLFDCATPQVVLPMAKRTAQNKRPARRPNISVSLPLSGWTTAYAIRYADPSHDTMAREPKSDAIVADNVDVMVLSVFVRTEAWE